MSAIERTIIANLAALVVVLFVLLAPVTVKAALPSMATPVASTIGHPVRSAIQAETTASVVKSSIVARPALSWNPWSWLVALLLALIAIAVCIYRWVSRSAIDLMSKVGVYIKNHAPHVNNVKVTANADGSADCNIVLDVPVYCHIHEGANGSISADVH